MTRWWFQIFFFHPYLGKISNLTNIFQMGGSTTNQMILLEFLLGCVKLLMSVGETEWPGCLFFVGKDFACLAC